MSHLYRSKSVLASVATLTVLCAASPAKAADEGACPTGANVVLVTGSSASKPAWASLGKSITDVKIVYYQTESCDGVLAATKTAGDTVSGNVSVTGKAIDYGTDSTGATTCDLAAGWVPTIGASDVFAASCTDVLGGALPSTLIDVSGPIQTMELVVPFGSDQVAIDAEQAYDIFKYAGTAASCDVGPWTDINEIFIRINKSGTRRMIGSAIGLDIGGWNETDSGTATAPKRVFPGSGSVYSALTGIADATTKRTAIGILSGPYVDDMDTTVTPAVPRRTKIKTLAYQAWGQKLAYLPDATAASYDKINVRTGQYPIWGPLHFITPGTGSTPSTASVATLMSYLTGATSLPGATTDSAFIDVVAKAHLIPQCAMKVTRAGEVTPTATYTPATPAKACGCYFEKSANGGAPTSASCKTCSSSTDCGTGQSCNYGFCEAS
ncbi:MAG: hypothetical protein ACHREM_06300 [Polyangiales bacterium]